MSVYPTSGPSGSIKGPLGSFKERLTIHLQSPLLRNGYALVLNSVVTSALGLLYWMLAANFYTAEAVGVNAALINAMVFLAQTSQLNLTNGVNRFLPTAGNRSTRFVGVVYAIILAAVPIVSLGYFAGLHFWAPTLAAIFADHWFAASFVLATMAWCLFAMQDSVLIGIRQAAWVPLENLVFALAKIILLVAVANRMPQWGLFFSWVVPMIFLLLPVNWVIFRRLTPKHVATTQNVTTQHETGSPESLTVGTVARYVAGDYVGSLVWTVTIGVLPMIVLEKAGATASAYFSIAWTIAYSLYLVSRNMGMSLISEAALDRDKLAQYSQRTLVQTYKLLIPVTAVVVVAAPWLLRLFGKEYSAEASTLLRLLALSALPAVIPAIYLSVTRVQRRILAGFMVQVSLCTLVLLIALLLLVPMGITAVGLAWLVGQSVIALFLLVSDFQLGTQGETFLQLASRQRNRWSCWRASKKIAALQPQIEHILAKMATSTDQEKWQVADTLPTLGDVSVLSLRRVKEEQSGAQCALLKFPLSEISVCYSLQQQSVLESIHANSKLGCWRDYVPKILAAGDECEQRYLVESLLPGVPMQTLLGNEALRLHLLGEAANCIGFLHQSTHKPTVVDTHLLCRWIDRPIAQLNALYCSRRASQMRAKLELLAGRLKQRLAGETLAVGWGHGDFAPCNILVSPDGSAITGIVDWEQALPNDLPILDIVFLLLSTRVQLAKSELGWIVGALVTGETLSPEEQALIDQAQARLWGCPVDNETLILLAWLRHVSMTIDKSERYRYHPLWRRNNIDYVLKVTSQ